MIKDCIIIDDLKIMSRAVCRQIKSIVKDINCYGILIDDDKKIEFKVIEDKLDEQFQTDDEKNFNIKKEDVCLIVDSIIKKIEEQLNEKKILVLIDTFLLSNVDYAKAYENYEEEDYFSARIYKGLLDLKLKTQNNNLLFFAYSRGEDGRTMVHKGLITLFENKKNKSDEDNVLEIAYSYDVISFVTCSPVVSDEKIEYNEKYPLNIPYAFYKILKNF